MTTTGRNRDLFWRMIPVAAVALLLWDAFSSKNQRAVISENAIVALEEHGRIERKCDALASQCDALLDEVKALRKQVDRIGSVIVGDGGSGP